MAFLMGCLQSLDCHLNNLCSFITKALRYKALSNQNTVFTYLCGNFNELHCNDYISIVAMYAGLLYVAALCIVYVRMIPFHHGRGKYKRKERYYPVVMRIHITF